MIRATPEPDESRSESLDADEPSAPRSADAAGRDETASERKAIEPTGQDDGGTERDVVAEWPSGEEPPTAAVDGGLDDAAETALAPRDERPAVASSSALRGDAGVPGEWGYRDDPPSSSPSPDSRNADYDFTATAVAATSATSSAAGTSTSGSGRGSTPPPPAGDRTDPPGAAPGLRTQLGATRGAVRRLVSSHVALAKAELADIMDEVKGVAILAGVAFGALVVVGFLIPIGLSLFIGETIFGSMGWGILHGPLFLTAVAVAALLVALGVGGGTVGRDFLIAAVLAIVVGVVLGLSLTNRAWSAAGDAIATGISPGIRPLVVAAASLAVVGGILGVIAGGRAGGMGGALGLGIFGVILGGLVGALTAISLGPRVGAALGVAVGLAAWPVLMGIGVSRRGIDTDALKARFYPDETIDTTKETIEWVRARTPLGPKS